MRECICEYETLLTVLFSVETAYKLDPRVRRMKEAEKARKEQMKQERREAARRREEEQRRHLEELQAKYEEERRRQMEEVRIEHSMLM